MFVLMSLILTCLRRCFALFDGMDRPSVPATRAQRAAKPAATPQPVPLALIHAPTLRLTL
ncbi:MAG: hypothetical protein A2Z93_08960 [Curvibacter sp. GWA2_64_110]|nr:MAG: hypothetical protein A2Z93_08960 [Curvibacter sp. GWA2_64_110]HCY14395.1 hypothetical protein [Curvibacter sp.]